MILSVAIGASPPHLEQPAPSCATNSASALSRFTRVWAEPRISARTTATEVATICHLAALDERTQPRPFALAMPHRLAVYAQRQRRIAVTDEFVHYDARIFASA